MRLSSTLEYAPLTRQPDPVHYKHGVALQEGSDNLWDLSAFHENLDARIDAETAAVLRELCRWSVSNRRADELDLIVDEHTAAAEDLSGEIDELHKRVGPLEKRMSKKRKLYADVFSDDALDSERQLAESMVGDLQREIDRIPEKVAGLGRDIEEHAAFITQLVELTTDLRSVRRPPLPDWLTPGT